MNTRMATVAQTWRNLSLIYGICSHQGRRVENEDSAAIEQSERGLLAIVADGMGGGVDGRVFSERAVAQVRMGMLAAQSAAERRAVEISVQLTSDDLHLLRCSNPDYLKSGTTLVVANLRLTKRGAEAVIVHIGDSRAYQIVANGHVQQLTRDHNYAESLIRDGTPVAAAYRHEQALRLTHALGDPLILSEVPDHLSQTTLAIGDWLVLCTDGVARFLAPSDYRMALSAASPQAAADDLIRRALGHGSRDNLTAIVIACRRKPRRLMRRIAIGGGLFAASAVAASMLGLGAYLPIAPIATDGANAGIPPTVTALMHSTAIKPREAGESPSPLPSSTPGHTYTATPTATATATATPTASPTPTNTRRPTRVPSATPTVPEPTVVPAPTGIPEDIPTEPADGEGITPTDMPPPEPATETPASITPDG